MNAVFVLGDGQLGAMLQEAGRRLGISVKLLSPETPVPLPPNAVITAEREHWPQNTFTEQIVRHPGWCNRMALELLPDRRTQKGLFQSLGLPTSPWLLVQKDTTREAIHSVLGPDFFLKSARGGYDGKGQLRFKQHQDQQLPPWSNEAIAEQQIPFIAEVSLLGARNSRGDLVFYELTENYHADGVLHISLKLPGRFSQWQKRAEEIQAALMHHLDYVGVMATEFFVTDEGLLINEVAPRVHNSGHWTQAGASISQFEMHLRAICDLPLPQPEQPGSSMMVNLIGEQMDPEWLALSGAQLYWYGKETRPGRKLGHVNFFHPDQMKLREWLPQMPLNDRYKKSRQWAEQRLSV